MDPNQRMIAYLQEAAEEVKRSDGSSVGVAEMLERFYFLVLYIRHTDWQTVWWRKTPVISLKIIN